MAVGGPAPRYQIVLTSAARKQLGALPRDVQARIAPVILTLGDDPRPHGARKLKGGSDEYRIRVGDYRVVYTIDDDNNIVLIVAVAHRRDVYRP
jgi:mRNA interferase RelE/StbE